MPTRLEFLRHVLPGDGVYVSAGISDKRVGQAFHGSLEELDVTLSGMQGNVFYAVAAFNEHTTRTVDNVKTLKTFFLDLDCGGDAEDRKFPDQSTALTELKQFVKDMKLPSPTIVNSGRGIHVYWTLTEPVTRLQWKPVAEKLKMMCVMKGFRADPAVTSDVARILRAPESMNVKDADNPLPVEVMRMGEPTPFDDLRVLLGVSEFEMNSSAIYKPPMDAVTKSLLANRPSVFKDILKKSVDGNGCAQILHAAGNQNTISEPMWRAVLSVAAHCADKDVAIHRISEGHPDYSRGDTIRKANATKGPYTCASFQNIDATLCEGCPHFGKITSPIVLGAGRVLEAEPEDNVVQVATTDEDGVIEEVVYEIPPFPFPFFRGKNGGVYVHEKSEDKQGNPVDEDILIYPYDFYLVSVIDDPHDGFSALFRVHFPRDGIREFCVPCADVLAKDRFRDVLAQKGIIASTVKHLEKLTTYSTYWVQQYQKTQRAKVGRVQFGWGDNYECFVVGDREIRHDGIVYSPPSATTINTVARFRKAGSLEKWQDIANFYRRPGMELHLFSLMAGFAAPLMPLLGVQGGIISLHSNTGGTGKTTTLHMVNSIFGHPKDAMLMQDDTPNARIHRMGVMNNIAVTTDEITNELPEVLSKLIYSMLQGRGKERMQASSNAERLNTTKWNTISVVTGNAVISDKLYLIKDLPDGELRRVLEFPFPKPIGVSKEESDSTFRPLMRNYGTAGEVYVQYLLNNMERIRDVFLAAQRRIDAAAELEQREQVWSNTATGIVTAAVLAKDSGAMLLTDEDIKRLYRWTVAQLKVMKATAVDAQIDPEDTLGMFMSQHVNDMLVINSASRAGAKTQEAPIREPKGKLILRYEPDTEELSISVSKFREFCTRRQISYNHIITELGRRGQYTGIVKKRLGKGTAISANERVLVFTKIGQDFVLGAERDSDQRNSGSH